MYNVSKEPTTLTFYNLTAHLSAEMIYLLSRNYFSSFPQSEHKKQYGIFITTSLYFILLSVSILKDTTEIFKCHLWDIGKPNTTNCHDNKEGMQVILGADGKQEVTDFFHNFQKGSEGKSLATDKNLQPVSPRYYSCNTSQLQPAGTSCVFNYFLV